MTPNPALDFSKIEALRKHMMLTQGYMAHLFGVSRVTYCGWVKGKPIRETNAATVRKVLRQLLAVLTKGWPTPEDIAATNKQRMTRLQELIAQ